MSNTHYAACDTILVMPIPDRHLVVSGSRDRSLVLWDVKGRKPSSEAPWSRVVSKKPGAHNVSKIWLKLSILRSLSINFPKSHTKM